MLKTHLPASITLPSGKVLALRYGVIPGIGLSARATIARIKERRGHYRRVEVLASNLRGRTDLHGRPYRPSEWIITDVDINSAPPQHSRHDIRN